MIVYLFFVGKKYSSKFFGKSWANCSPQTVVACLGFAKSYWKYINDHSEIVSIEKYLETTPDPDIYLFIQNEFSNISMNKFIVQYAPNQNPLDVQIALYVQG